MSDTDLPKIIITGGSYEKPKVKRVYKFKSEEEMFVTIERFTKWNYPKKEQR